MAAASNVRQSTQPGKNDCLGSTVVSGTDDVLGGMCTIVEHIRGQTTVETVFMLSAKAVVFCDFACAMNPTSSCSRCHFHRPWRV